MYRPTMSRTFSMSLGSREIVNVSLRCGCNPNARQIRPTVVWLSPCCFAIVRVLQRLDDHLLDRGVVDRARRPGTRFIEQAVEPLLDEALALTPHGIR
jgi:hypothetical protein